MKLHNLNRLATLAVVPLLLLYSCGKTYHGEGERIEEQRKIEHFNKLVLNMNAVVTITDTPEFSCTIIAQQNILEAIVTRLDGKTLVITSKGNLITDKPIEIVIGMNQLAAIEVNGSGEIYGRNTFKNSDFDFEVNGSGKLELDLVAVNVSGAVTGSGLSKISGSANSLNIEINGSGTIDASKFSTIKAKTKLSGSGEADLMVSESLEASVSGSGKVNYRGNAEVDKNISGSGEVRKLD